MAPFLWSRRLTFQLDQFLGGRSIQLRPDNTSALESRGHSYAHLAEYERAIKDWNRAFEVESEHELV